MSDKLTIFYTDDDIDDLEFFKSIVKMINKEYEVVTYMDGFQLLDALDNPPPNPQLLFLDINMPGLNGIEILEKIRKSEKHGKLPIIMFSTSNDEWIVKKTFDLGANYYLPKADNFKKLRIAIEHALDINWSIFIPDKRNYLYSSN